MLGITGEIGVGKSTLAQLLAGRLCYPIVEIDDVRRYILWQSTELEHVCVREDLAHAFGLPFSQKNAWINRQTFTTQLFSDASWLAIYSKIATPVIQDYVLKHYSNNSLLVWVYLLEEGYDVLCDTIIDVHSRTALVRDQFLNHRYQIQKRFQEQLKRKTNETEKKVTTYYREDDIDTLLDTIRNWYANT